MRIRVDDAGEADLLDIGPRAGLGGGAELVATTATGWVRTTTCCGSCATTFVAMIRAEPSSSNLARPSRKAQYAGNFSSMAL